MDTSTTVLESQLDWLTAAAHTADGMRYLEHCATRWATAEVAAGSKVRPFRLNGYVGWQAGRVRYGARDAAGLVQLSGDLAERHFDYLYPVVDNVSRLDLAVTVRTPVPDDTIGLFHYQQAILWRRDHPRSARPSHHADGDSGWTTYLGERTSDFFFRCYNKQRESEAANDPESAAHYAACWRYELECKGVTAPAVARSMRLSENRPVDVQSFVHDYCTRHGLFPIFDRAGGQELVAGFRRRSDRETRLDWLQTAVRPAVKWLLQTGDRTEVLERLGLVDLPGNGDTPQG